MPNGSNKPILKTKNQKRQFSKDKGKGIISFEKCRFPVSDFIKCPINIGDHLKDSYKGWKEFKLYVRFLDLKAQNPNCGTFKIEHSHRAYQRIIDNLIKRDWAWREGRTIRLRAYQAVWKSMGIPRLRVGRILKFRYWKFPVSGFSDDRKTYLKQIEFEIRKKIAKRKLVQIGYALRVKGELVNMATFSSRSTSYLFGYKSSSTGTKLRNEFFEVVQAESKPYYNEKRGRYEEPTKRIHL